jgi:GTP-binding protein YchF
VVRCFKDDDVIHVEGDVDPIRDIQIIDSELLYKDLESIEKRVDKLRKQVKGDKTVKTALDVAEKLREHVENGEPVRSLDISEEERLTFSDLFLLTAKPVLFVCNVSEEDIANEGINNEMVNQVRDLAQSRNCNVVVVCASIEAEIAELDDDAKAEFLKELNIESAGLDQLIRAAYAELGLITYFTAGEKEVRAWTIIKGMKAPQAAGVIHSDFERGFIRAETIAYNDFVAFGSEAAAKEAGKLRSEGREYLVKDGDVMHFRFNV